MKNVQRRKPYTAFFDLGEAPVAAPTVTLFHEWGDQVGGTLTSTLDSGNIYKVDLTSSHTESSGVLKLKWSYMVGSSVRTQNSFINIYTPYIDDLTFFDIEFNSFTTAVIAVSIPRFKSIGFAPAATFLYPKL